MTSKNDLHVKKKMRVIYYMLKIILFINVRPNKIIKIRWIELMNWIYYKKLN